MLRVVDRVFGHAPPWHVVAFSLACIVVIGFLDHFTGSEIAFSIFYLLPVSLVTWYRGLGMGLAACLLSALSWLAVDVTAQSYSAGWIPFWNAGARLGFFSLTSYLLADLRARLEREHEQARTDALTGVRNSRAFSEEAQMVLSLASRSEQPIAIGYLDVDNFKALNDSLGHAEGDRVLRRLCATMRSSLRATDIIGRLGGDEFAIALPQADMTGARQVFETLHRRLTEEIAASAWPIGFSIGVAVFRGDLPNVQDAIKRADGLMYEIKRSGKGGIAYADCSARRGDAAHAAASAPRRTKRRG